MEFRDISRVSEAITAKRMKIDPYCQRRNCSPLNALFVQRCIGYVDIAGRSPPVGRQTNAGWENKMRQYHSRRAGLSATAGLSCSSIAKLLFNRYVMFHREIIVLSEFSPQRRQAMLDLCQHKLF